MIEEVLVTLRANPKVDPSLGIWSWEVPVYLFLGGMTAGILVFASLVILLGRDKEFSFTAKKLVLWAPVVLSLGMGALFLDLEHKLYVWRFYTTFQPASPMSWGSWILLLIYPISVLLILAYLREAYPTLAKVVDRAAVGRWLTDYAIRNRLGVAKWGVILGVFLAFYTGILLSAFSARPFWNTGFLAPLFLVSGLSAAAALTILFSPSADERHYFTKVDIGLIAVELALLAMLLTNLSTGVGPQLSAVELIMGGDYTVMFWVFFVLPGLLLPVILEYWELTGTRKAWMFISPVLVLYGGFMLRHVTVALGQASSWVNYSQQFSPELLQLVQ
ncbi:MAG: polysulfide reductase NrfD [Gammaproteobacteria bacterium]|nr:polysulfide reductase NrfD [Gammaproteobacteria bacterium]